MNWHRLVGLVVIGLLMSFGLTANGQGDSGKIAVRGVDGNIYVYDMATAQLTPVTRDASLTPPERFYAWATWSTDGQLAFFGTSLDPANPFGLGIFIQQVGKSPKGVYAGEEEFFTYAYWSPADCPLAEAGCRDLAVLYTTAEGLATRLVRSAESFTVTEIAQGGPFYWDWSPDGASMLWARDGRIFEIYDVATAESNVLPYPQGLEAAADWSPVDDRLLAAVYDPNGVTTLSVIEGDDQRVLVKDLVDGVAAQWSPTGEHIAYIDLHDGGLHVLESASGTEIALPNRGVLAFNWSPDGQKVAYVTITTFNPDDRPNARREFASSQAQPGPVGLQWNVYDLNLATSFTLNTFLPSEAMIYYLSFFDQFALSHQLWSPDSRYLVFGEVTMDGGQHVSIVDTTSPGTPPFVVAEGTMGIFSW
jgi:TolB protein